MCWQKLKQLLHRAPPRPEEEAIKEKPPRKWWQFPFRLIKTSRGGINMPGQQPCPQCRAKSKRQAKTLGGANYSCRTHDLFFIKHPHPPTFRGER